MTRPEPYPQPCVAVLKAGFAVASAATCQFGYAALLSSPYLHVGCNAHHLKRMFDSASRLDMACSAWT